MRPYLKRTLYKKRLVEWPCKKKLKSTVKKKKKKQPGRQARNRTHIHTHNTSLNTHTHTLADGYFETRTFYIFCKNLISHSMKLCYNQKEP
jgi:hypothetical protein